MQNHFLVHGKLVFRSYQLKLLALLGGLLILLMTTAPAWSESKPFMDPLIQASKARAELVQSVQQSVVHIKVEQKLVNVRGPFQNRPRQEGSGSGAIVRSDGYILTNHHVVGEADKITVQLYDGQELKARLIGTDPATDISVIKIEGTDMPVLQMGDSDNILVGESVIAIGNPFGLDTTMTVGVVSALGREIDSVTRRKISDVIQTDAAINPGNSGGPLLNSLGELVGVNTAIYSPSGGSSGIGFAIPANTVNRIVPELIQFGRIQTPILGINLLPQAEYYRRLWKIDGVIVLDTIAGGEPERLGMRGLTRVDGGRIRLGDVIVRLDEESISNENDLAAFLENKRAGERVTVTTRRDNRVLEYEIELQAPPSP